ncbi:hypothetical protein M885DRAFT_510138 [Pelagophyceae sp. CCMP2097]|nr:hypothetical protein M885DRAFT_510138 [Pelagophyceae sp. CCMP2097]
METLRQVRSLGACCSREDLGGPGRRAHGLAVAALELVVGELWVLLQVGFLEHAFEALDRRLGFALWVRDLALARGELLRDLDLVEVGVVHRLRQLLRLLVHKLIPHVRHQADPRRLRLLVASLPGLDHAGQVRGARRRAGHQRNQRAPQQSHLDANRAIIIPAD